MDDPDPERAPRSRKVSEHGAWAMATGGMIGGGVFTLTGVLLGTAGALAWVSLAIGAVIALATVRSYARLTIATKTDAVPVTVFSADGQHTTAGILAGGLLVVYILALAVYTFTVGHYLGAALGVGEWGIAGLEVLIVGLLVALNLRHATTSTGVQTAIVWIEIVILLGLAVLGIVRWDGELVTRGVPGPSLLGVLTAAALTFVAFEGFEMLAYDVRELRRPRSVLRTQLARSVIAVAVTYALVTLGAASLVGADVLVENEEHALAVAGRGAAGQVGMIVVTLAACAAGISAINATLFSVARLARTSAERGLLPAWCSRCNRHDAPTYSIFAIAIGALAVAMTTPLTPLVGAASLGFLTLFCVVNVLAVRKLRQGRWVAAFGALGAGGGAALVSVELAREHPISIVAVACAVGLGALLHLVRGRRRVRS